MDNISENNRSKPSVAEGLEEKENQQGLLERVRKLELQVEKLSSLTRLYDPAIHGYRYKWLTFATESAAKVQSRLLEEYPNHYEKAGFKFDYFPNGDPNPHYLLDDNGEYLTRPNSRNCIVLASVRNSRDMEQLTMINRDLVKRGVPSIVNIILKFGSDTMDREPEGIAGQIVTAEYRADQISNSLAGANVAKVLIVHPHVPQLVHYLDTLCNPKAVSTLPHFTSAVAGFDISVIATTDVGGSKLSKKVIDYKEHMVTKSLCSDAASPASEKLGLAIVCAIRDPEGIKKKILSVLSDTDLTGATVALVDDLSRSLKSIRSAIYAIRELGAGNVVVMLSHYEGDLKILKDILDETFRGELLVNKFLVLDTTPESEAIEDLLLRHPEYRNRVEVRPVHRIIHPPLETIAGDVSWIAPESRESLMLRYGVSP